MNMRDDERDVDEGDLKPERKTPAKGGEGSGGGGGADDDDEKEDEIEVIEVDEDRPARRGAADDDDDERRGSTRKRHKSRPERNAARAAAEARDKAIIAEQGETISQLTRRLDALEGRQTESDKREVGQSLANVEAAIANLRARKTSAIAAIARGEGDPATLEEVDAALDDLRDQRKDLVRLKEDGEKKGGRGDNRGGDRGAEGTGGRRPLSRAEQDTVNDFLSEHSWIDPAGRDADSRRALAIDQKMVQEGFRPSHDDWKSEFTARLKKALPHQFQDDDDDDTQPRRRRSAPTGGRGREGGSSRTQVILTPERKQMLADGNHEKGSDSYKRILREWAKIDEREARGG